MAIAKAPSRVKLIMGVLFTSEGVLIQAKSRLTRKFGPIDRESTVMPFVHTSYYEKEMGQNLKRQFFSFKKLIQPQTLADIKRYTNSLEKIFSKAGKPLARAINIDPGYIEAAKLVLATCKNYSHRIYLNKGVFAEVTLEFHSGTFTPRPWTYPDYSTQAYIDIFNSIRQTYLTELGQ